MSRIDDLIAEYCPDGVKHQTLGEIGEFIRGNGIQKRDFQDSGFGCIHYGQIYTYYGLFADHTKSFIDPNLAEKRKKAYKGDLVIATTSENEEDVCKACAWLGEEPIAISGDAYIFRHHQNPKYISYCFQSELFQSQKKKYITGTKVLRVNGDAMAKIHVPVPPLPVQEEIVRILDSFSSLEAELEAELEARRKQYAYYRNELLTFERVVTVCIQDICIRICSGGTPSSKRHDYYDGNVPWLRTQDIDFNVINQTSATISDEGLRNSAAQWIPANCVIVAMYGATAAKVAVNSIPLTTNQACCNLQIDETKADVRYVFHWLSNEYEHLKALGEGSQSNINAKKVKSYPISLPPLEEQRRIVSILDRFDKLTNDLSSGLPAEIEARHKQYEYYRDRLLSFDELAA
ncbi:restriction endonuclease subunit S [Bifidobacterium bifidum]|uniref:restriction endonuclease subunit S n=1 Tax=Bifidobacterium bifidum TaxID=1681 RepID=UPI00232E538D|nr:restriction endonuclease subunit S [Bifidobacterium bifidum]MDB1226368.1 restriction endonuclease subunit S [Bifidobacterium bifidum]MDB1227621.1 restriction endonuclease subunit S [Bifidobacterium bifidum]MDB1230739.1 restriction endonuclease subunit S [Bifidobacterium bifidum]MDB1231152.1 restriction endonuclease subunit S [Bifidobacterium bifidum]MDB1234222.1 restriction endonuclease subunit S [Bifidobacterium bifidum]